MGRSTNVKSLTNTRIQKEQLQLCKIEKELEKILGKVNEAVNELKVEELQLKAAAAAALSENYSTYQNSTSALDQPSTSSSTNLALVQSPQRLDTYGIADKDDHVLNEYIINQQVICLNMNSGKNGVEEEDEDM